MAHDDTNPDLWTAQQVAAYLDIDPGSVRRQLSRWGISRAGTGESEAGRIIALYPAAEVRTAHEARPGRGAGGGPKRKAS